MNELIEKLTAALDTQEAARRAYDLHVRSGPHLNFPDQDPDTYATWHDTCYICDELGAAIRRATPDEERILAAHRKILEWASRPNCAGEGHQWVPPDPSDLPEFLAEAYGIEVDA
jgi:hypothetical protein